MGSGKPITSFSTLTSRVIVAYLMAYAFDLGYSSCWLNIPIGWGLGVAMSLPRYFSKKWMAKRVVAGAAAVEEAI